MDSPLVATEGSSLSDRNPLRSCDLQGVEPTSQPPAVEWFLPTFQPTILTAPSVTTSWMLESRRSSSSPSRSFKSKASLASSPVFEEHPSVRASGKRLACFLAHSSCVYDGVKIYSLASGEAVLAALCGSSVPGPVLTFGPMLLHFYSDSVLTDAGFMAEYRAIRKFRTRTTCPRWTRLQRVQMCVPVSKNSSNESRPQPWQLPLYPVAALASAAVTEAQFCSGLGQKTRSLLQGNSCGRCA